MDAKEELTTKLTTTFSLHGDDVQRLYILLDDYDIANRCFEVGFNTDDINRNLLEQFLATKIIKGCSKNTVGEYMFQLKAFAAAVGKPFTEIKAGDIKAYLARRMIVDKVSPVTRNNEYSALSSFYQWMLNEEYIDRNPVAKVERAKEPKIKKKAFTEREIERLRNACQTKKERCLIEVLLSTWCRVSEVAGMDISAINTDGSMIVFGKGAKERTVYLNEKAQMAIEDYLEERSDEGLALFVNGRAPYERMQKFYIEKVIRAIGERAGVTDCHPHRFRRTGATYALRAGMPVEIVSMILGHEDLNTTKRYLDIDNANIKYDHKKYSRI